ncbi:MaoC/PaaZ C-terminal domain-containing protein [Ottowia thiooxydans]|uniref:Acyl dehydratase n=1 Tax=Ottowia thiooxydans TaxID=219182 RepID=A0ABV2Q5B9_9BURK
MLNYDIVRNWSSGDVRHSYTKRDTMLYALGIGMGQDPMNEAELAHVTESELRAVPSMAAVIATPGFWMRDSQPSTGIDTVRMVHGEQSVVIHRPLPSEATVSGCSKVVSVVDKGEGKGAIVYVEKRISDEQGELLATCLSTVFCRGDGGFSGGAGGDAPLEPPPATPDRVPDFTIDLETRPETALIYRLSGDYNPLHSDPRVAKAAGFPKPILHGLGTYGAACRGLLAGCFEHESNRMRSIRARFSSPVYPGDKIVLDIWAAAADIQFRARVPARDATVLTHGHAKRSA